MKLEIPEPLKIAEAELRADLAVATGAGGKTAEAARALNAIFLPYLLKEQEEVLQPLGLLGELAEGKVRPDMVDALPTIKRLKQELATLHEEHNAVFDALKKLVAAAKSEGKGDSVRFGERLIVRVWVDEAVSYPAAILIGEHLKLRLRRQNKPQETE
jgi:hypothetical protein